MDKISFRKIGKKSGLRSALYVLESGLEPGEFYSGDGAGWVVKWNVKGGDEGVLIARVPNNIFSLCLLRSLNLLAIGTLQGELFLIELQSNTLLPRSYNLGSAIYDLKHVQNYLYAATGSGLLYSLDLGELHLHGAVVLSAESIRSIAVIGGEKLVVGSSSGKLILVDLNKKTILNRLGGHDNSVFSVLAMQNGDLLSGSRDAHIHLWRDESLLLRVPAHLLTVNKLVALGSSGLFASASRDRSVKIWSAAQMKLLKVIDSSKTAAHNYSVNTLLWLENEGILLSAGDDKQILLWEIAW